VLAATHLPPYACPRRPKHELVYPQPQLLQTSKPLHNVSKTCCCLAGHPAVASCQRSARQTINKYTMVGSTIRPVLTSQPCRLDTQHHLPTSGNAGKRAGVQLAQPCCRHGLLLTPACYELHEICTCVLAVTLLAPSVFQNLQ
jgi:hypothetical protein